MAHHPGNSWTERHAAERSTAGGDDIEYHARTQSFKNPHTSLGAPGHIVHMAAMLFPVLAAELIDDAVKYRKAVRIGSIATTVLYEGLYTAREMRRRSEQEAKLAECRSEHAEHHER